VVTILLLSLTLFLLFLTYERVVLNRLRRSIPMVIAVTGTRGKSSVVRMLASVLRESGRVVLAKTTGSQAQFILPDGTIQDVPRRGMVSILEQKKVLNSGAELHAECVVVEIMSIRPENHIVESQQVLKPDVVVVTNVRRDHLEAMGETEPEIAHVLCNDLPPGCTVYVPEEYAALLVSSHPRKQSTKMRSVQRGRTQEDTAEFAENLNLVAALSRDLGIAEEVVTRGIQHTRHDIGKLRIWRHTAGGKGIFLVNAFAANDPDSTMIIYQKVARALSAPPSSFTGLLNLRHDRPDRTLQWIEALKLNGGAHFNEIYALDGHSQVVRRNVKTVNVLPQMAAAELTGKLIDNMQEGGVLFGFGNIGGMGQALVDHWQRVGEEYGI
jgi:poly-gamma-glutamate synthase PgsB/CapB